nr:WAS/WASL-interacting protein family member 3-like [Aegilops tauschii subsp. strangulata]
MLASSQGEELPALDPLAAFAVRPPHPTTSSPLLAPATSTNEHRRLAPPLSLASSPWTCTLPGAPPPEIARPQPPPRPETQRHPFLEPAYPPLATAAVPRPSSSAPRLCLRATRRSPASSSPPRQALSIDLRDQRLHYLLVAAPASSRRCRLPFLVTMPVAVAAVVFCIAKSQQPRPSASPRQTVDVLPPVPCPRWLCSSTPPLRLKFCYMSTSSSATGAPQLVPWNVYDYADSPNSWF